MLINRIFFIVCLFTSCSFAEPFKHETTSDRFDKERSKVIHRVLKKFIKNMETKGYRAAGIGEGLDHSTENKRQNCLEVTFDIERLPNIEFARKVEIEALQELQRYINSENGIQDYVAEYPFPIKFLNIAFISKLRDVDLCMVSNFEEKIYYCIDEPGKPLQGPLIEIHRESYDEAVQILEQQ